MSCVSGTIFRPWSSITGTESISFARLMELSVMRRFAMLLPAVLSCSNTMNEDTIIIRQ